ncbi:MAG TPA: HEAT repeat domain-containing protein, partial [Ardenticatenaceae bacterium]
MDLLTVAPGAEPSLLQSYLVGAAGDGTGGLAVAFASTLVGGLRKVIRDRFQQPEQQQALQRAIAIALYSSIEGWDLTQDDAEFYRNIFRDWLLDEDVAREFRLLLVPDEDTVLDIELLHEVFREKGLNIETFGQVSFEELIQDMVGGFYGAAANEPTLQEPIKIGLLQQMAERMGALERIAARHLATSTRATSHLESIQTSVREVVQGQGLTNELLEQLVSSLSLILNEDDINQWRALQLLERELPAISRDADAAIQKALEPVNELLAQIRDRLSPDGAAPSPEQLAQSEALYCQTIIDQFEKLTFKGIAPSGTPISLPLEEVYVELKAVADVPVAADTYSADERRLLLEAEGRGDEAMAELAIHLDTLRAERWNLQARQGTRQLERRSIQETLSDGSQRGVVILGDPGSGKTTLLHYLALRVARGAPISAPPTTNGHKTEGASLLPIFVPLAAYDDYLRRKEADCSLADFLALYYDKWHSLPGLAPLFQGALEEGRALVLLDGLDEVLDTAARQFVSEQATALIRQWAPRGNRFALTSRIVGYREAPLSGDLPHVTVLDFGRTEIELFAHQWCRSYEVWLKGDTPTAHRDASAEEQDLLEDVRSNPSVERLAASPLLLTMLALLRRHVGKLPDRRVELYERYVRTLIDNWELARTPGARQRPPERFDHHTAISHLMELALWLQQNKPSGTARRQELEEQLAVICLRFEGHDPDAPKLKERVQAEQDTTHFLKDMRHFAGLLAERGRDAFGFLHLTFQEYFTGRALARMSPDERWNTIQPNLHRSRWREPILLCAGQLGVIEQRRELVSGLVRRILDAGSEHEEILHRDLFLATAIASDNVGLSNAILDQITQRLTPLGSSKVPVVRDTALAGLAQLARIGHQPALTYLQESLNAPEQNLHVITAVKSVLGSETGASLRQATIRKLDSDTWIVRETAVRSLVSLALSHLDVRQALLARLEDEWWAVRLYAVRALASLITSDEEVRQMVRAKVDDADNDVRQAAIEALAPLMSKDEEVQQILLECLNDSWSNVQQAAIGVLVRLISSDEQVRETLVARLEDEAWNVRQAAVQALAPLVTSDEQMHEALLARLEDETSSVRQVAVEALAPLVTSDEQVHEALVARLEDETSSVRGSAVQALAPLVTSDEQVRGALVARLEDEAWNVRQVAV